MYPILGIVGLIAGVLIWMVIMAHLDKKVRSERESPIDWLIMWSVCLYGEVWVMGCIMMILSAFN